MCKHRRGKLLNVGGGGAKQARLTSILGGGGAGGIAKSTYVLNIHTTMHTYVCMHAQAHTCMPAQPMQTYILHPNMKIIKIKASNLYEKTATKIGK